MADEVHKKLKQKKQRRGGTPGIHITAQRRKRALKTNHSN